MSQQPQDEIDYTNYYNSYGQAWDCDPLARVSLDPYDEGLDEEDSTSDWQTLVLDRFGDRLVSERMFKPLNRPMFDN